MDPLSISASIAGLLTLAGATVAKLDALFNNDIRSRPAVLLGISQEISALCLVLGQLEGQLCGPNSSGTKENEENLLAVLDLCMGTFRQIGSQISELQSRLRKGSLSKAYAFMLYPSRMKAISALRDDLEKCKATLLIALQMHKQTEDSVSPEALRQEIGHLRKTLEVHQPGISVDLERMDVIKNYLVASSTTLLGEDCHIESSSSVVTAGVQQDASPIAQQPEGQVGLTASFPRIEGIQSSADGMSDVPTFGSFNDWLSTFSPEPETADPEEDELLSAFRNRQKNNSMNDRIPTATIDAVEVESPAQMIPSSDTLSLVSQHLPIRRDLRDGKVHVILVNLRKPGSDKTFTEDLVISPDILVYKLIHELHQKGYTKICGFQSIDRQSTYSPIVSHNSLLSPIVTAGPSNYNMPSGLQINIDERLIDFYNRFILDGTATPAWDLISVKRSRDSIRIHDRRLNKNMDLKLQRTLRVPEDGKPYPLPAYFGSYPLLNVETFSDRLPLHMRMKGGLFIPMFQREALSLDFDCTRGEEAFAIRIFAGSVNAISGKTAKSQLSEGEQDYIVVPNQRRLDGFLAGKGEVKQFVTMPLGFGYSVEKQVTGAEFIGGIQLEIIPRLNEKVKFIRPQHHTTKSPWLTQQLDSSEDIFRTPRELGMAPGQRLLMRETWPKSRRMTFDLGFLGDNNIGNSRRQDILPVHKEKCRPTFVHEMFLGTGQRTYSMNESLVLHPVEPLSLRVDWQAIVRSPKGTTVEEYSPFLDISDFKEHISSIKKESESRGSWRAGYVLLNGTVHKGYPEEYSPLAEYALDEGIISFKEDPSVLARRNGDYVGASQTGPREPTSRWEMALGAGGSLGQSIEKTKDKRLWDWGASKLINIQILNSVAFKGFTGISPVTPISFREYVAAKIPFYSFLSVSENSMLGDHATTFKSIGQLDRSAVIQIGIRINRSGKPVGCANCENNICDSILQPCKHTFCSECIKFRMTSDSSITCAFCDGPVSETIAFSAPMEMPFSTPKEKMGLKAIEPILPSQAEDTIHEIPSSLLAQQGETDKSSSNVVEDLVAVLLEMVKDEVSSKATPDGEISALLADAIAGYGRPYSVLRFDMAIHNLTQTSIDIRVPIFKAALQKAIEHSSMLHHITQLLLLVPSIDDIDDHNTEFVRRVILAAGGGEIFTTLFQWIMDGRRSIEDFGLSVGELFVLAVSDDALDILLKFIADRKQTLSDCGVSIMTTGKHRPSKIKKLIESGCDPNEQNAEGKTLLHLADDSPSYVETLLALGSRIDIVDNDGNTSIHLAVRLFQESRLAALLRDKSCTPTIVNIRNQQGLTAYRLSLQIGQPAYMRKRLLDAGGRSEDVDAERAV